MKPLKKELMDLIKQMPYYSNFKSSDYYCFVRITKENCEIMKAILDAFNVKGLFLKRRLDENNKDFIYFYFDKYGHYYLFDGIESTVLNYSYKVREPYKTPEEFFVDVLKYNSHNINPILKIE